MVKFSRQTKIYKGGKSQNGHWLYQILLRIFLFFAEFIGITHIYYLFSFGTTGVYYRKSSCPELGSALYTFFYFIYSLIPILLIRFFYWWVIVVIFVVYVVLCFFIFVISYNTKTRPDEWIPKIIAHSIIAFVIFLALLLISIFCT